MEMRFSRPCSRAFDRRQRTITFENFLLKEGEIWKQFARAFAERARAGVKVHFLQDAMGCDCLHGEGMKLLKRSGVEVEIFRFYQLSQMNYRTHRKLLTIDGRIGFIGGTGIADAWQGDGQDPGILARVALSARGPGRGPGAAGFH